MPSPLPDVTRKIELRVSNRRVRTNRHAEYSVPPGLAGRRVQATLSLEQLVVKLEGRVIADHVRPWLPTDVASPAQLLALKEHRQARQALTCGDGEIPAPTSQPSTH